MFKTEAKKSREGNFDVEASCSEQHTSFKKRGDSNPYECPYCGRDVP